MSTELMPLISLRGMIASCAIENREHEWIVKKIDRLIEEYGPLCRVDADKTIHELYGGTDDH